MKEVVMTTPCFRLWIGLPQAFMLATASHTTINQFLEKPLDIASFGPSFERMRLVAKMGSCPIPLTSFLYRGIALLTEPMWGACRAVGGLFQTQRPQVVCYFHRYKTIRTCSLQQGRLWCGLCSCARYLVVSGPSQKSRIS